MNAPKQPDPSQSKTKNSARKPPLLANISDRLVTLEGGRTAAKPQAWPPTFEEFAAACDPRTSLF